MKRLALLFVLLAAVVAGSVAGSAHGAVPCRDRVYNDWYATGKIPSDLPISCYRDALKNIPADARIYSSLGDDIKAAMQGAIERSHGVKSVPAEIGAGKVSLGKSGVAGASSTKLKGSQSQPQPGNDGSGASTSTLASGQTSSGGGIPLPIIILGGVALLLAAAGAVGAGARHFRRR
ncbi:MAG TPA: hypothetical protein VFB25_00795 [Gaiellaceae bacterium]|nr:hypothetical protein [Gaiellaceae bacterium]